MVQKTTVTSRRKPKPPRFSARTRQEYQQCIDLVVAARLRSGLSQKDLADRLGVAQSWVGKAETGVRRLDFVELIDIALAVGTEPVELFNEVQKRLKELRQSAAKRRK